jgi:hypothetical protein
MPLASDPNARRNYVLKADRKSLAAARALDPAAPDNAPRFIYRYLTRRQKQAYLDLDRQDDAEIQGRDPEQTIALLYTRLGEILTGWRGLVDRQGQPVLYDGSKLPELLDDLLTEKELWELYYVGANEMEEADLDFFASRPNMPPDVSASPDKQDAPAASV